MILNFLYQDTIAWAFQKDSPYLDIISHHLGKLHEGGIIGRLLRNYLNDVVKPNCEETQFKAISYENIFSAFFVITVGVILAIFVAIYEKMYFNIIA